MVRFETNPVMDKLRGGQAAVGSWLSLCSPVAAESMAQIGWDWLAINAEHSPIGFETLVNCFRAVQLGGAIPIARVPYNDPVWIQRVLDAGALGITVPTISTAEQAQQIVRNARYALVGERSYGGSRVAPYIEGDYRTWTDDNLVIIAMIESIQGVENAEAILSVEGITGCLIGPNDLAISMGLRPEDQGPGTPHEEAVMRVLAAAKKTGKVAGKNCYTAAEVTMRIAQGFQFLSISSDAGYMAKAAGETFAAIDFTGGAG
jgi:4-hydroxy-2-oxoheptanedioate aldolase